ncbi:hypothetical protein E2C01_008577 [Portunus trituberculatus]|uniref:Uncharacterized protein n=1 Tax=Portunus trituberculatus TaxID=210409 RepID=A0A5B7D5I9_PORTR|nr:hypothetical protein [Portunus trituberculatus]
MFRSCRPNKRKRSVHGIRLDFRGTAQDWVSGECSRTVFRVIEGYGMVIAELYTVFAKDRVTQLRSPPAPTWPHLPRHVQTCFQPPLPPPPGATPSTRLSARPPSRPPLTAVYQTSYGHPSLRQEPSPLDTEITQCAAHTLAAPRYLISRVSSRRELHYRSGIGAAQRTPALHALVLSPRAEWIKLRRARTATLLPPPLLLPIPPHSANHTNKHNFELTKFLR